jgi:protoheme IX farnesyltransferase
MTNSIDLTAIYLFVIIFYWTPPHFWALALLKRRDYAKAGVPMLPVIRGERRTKVEMLVYALLLMPITLLPAAFGAFGMLYVAAAVLLGARLLWYCVKLLRETQMQGTEWKMYRYSLLYLALLFLAMAVDRRLLPHPVPPPAVESVLILDAPHPAGTPLPGMPGSRTTAGAEHGATH